MDEKTVRREIKNLVDKFEKIKEEGKYKKYNEEQTKKNFILPLFRALGWDVESDDVKAEEKVSKKRVDYAFRINGHPKFYLECKPFREFISEPKYAKQAIEYAWNKSVTWAILCNFEGIRVFNAEWKWNDKQPMRNQFLDLRYTDYLGSSFEYLSWLSRESFEKGILDEKATVLGKKTTKKPIGEQLLADFTEYRDILSKDILKNNKNLNLSHDELDEAVQRILDRIIFMRTCEDKEIESDTLESLIRIFENRKEKIFTELNKRYREYDEGYNSKLFQEHLCEKVVISDSVLKEIIFGTYRSKNFDIRYDFSAIDADVLGNIYEQYLGHILKKTPMLAKIKNGKIHRKEQGIYYTPTYIVDYIVRNTLVNKLKKRGIKPDEIKLIDPACGSGSFLLKAFDALSEFVVKEEGKTQQTKFEDVTSGKILKRKTELLKNTIFGVDLDGQAVEITQLNLLLKLAEKRYRLPTLKENIKIGNTLIQDPIISENKGLNWTEEFKEIIDNGGFDVIIGNPPWGAKINEDEKSYFKENYESVNREIDSHNLFIEKSIDLLKNNGYLGFIVPNTWMYLDSTETLRKKILDNCRIVKIVELTKYIFADAPDIIPVILILEKNKSNIKRKNNKIAVYSFSDVKKINQNDLYDISYNKINQNDIINANSKIFNLNLTEDVAEILDKIKKNSKNLSELVKTNYGIKTGDNKKYLRNEKEPGNFKKCLKTKEIQPFKIKWKGLWLNYGEQLAGFRKDNIEVPKIIIQYIRKLSLKRRLICGFDEEGEYYPLNNYSYITGDKKVLKCIIGILNSRLMNFYYSYTFIDYNIKPTYIGKIPIKYPIDDILKNKLINYVSDILKLNNELVQIEDKKIDKKTSIENKIAKLNIEIDNIIYKIYGLSNKQIVVVENNTNY